MRTKAFLPKIIGDRATRKINIRTHCSNRDMKRILSLLSLAHTALGQSPWDNGELTVWDPPGEAAPGSDWVLILDDISRNFNPPGAQ